jgi:hypothetical protein
VRDPAQEFPALTPQRKGKRQAEVPET